MNQILSRIKQLSMLLSIPALAVLYQFLNNPDGPVYSLVTNIDRGVPFLNEFIIPYLCFYPYIFLVLCYLCFKDKRIYYKTLLSINIGYLLSFLIYFLFQTNVPRPIVIEQDLLSSLVTFTYRFDNPYNAFPSLHVLTSYLMIKAVNQSKDCSKRSKVFIFIFSTIIIISTQLVKQHVIFDLAAGVLLGDIIFEMVTFLDERTILKRIIKH